ncbi:MAG: lysozyme [Candidatus Berkelbacteria bacterium]|nr:lysozyme [Candidatus Berkelbacteria bacterium]
MTNRALIATLVLSAAGFAGILTHEAYREKAYNDGGGVSTFGFGTTKGVKPGDKISVEQALVRALSDVSKFEGALKKCVKVPLSQNEYDAYVSLAYNIGATAFCTSTLVKKLNLLDYSGACREISRWNKVGVEVSRGLKARRAREYALCIKI